MLLSVTPAAEADRRLEVIEVLVVVDPQFFTGHLVLDARCPPGPQAGSSPESTGDVIFRLPDLGVGKYLVSVSKFY